MKNQMICYCFLGAIFAINGFYCVPIFTDEEKLKSIVISEIDLPTEQSILTENLNAVDSGKSETFVQLYEKYDELFNKNSTAKKISESSEKLQKRSSSDDVENESNVENTQSIIEKSQTIIDPEVRKEFEVDLNNHGQIVEDESAKFDEGGTEYDPNYARKIVSIPEKENEIANVFVTEGSVQDLMVKENSKMLIEEPTTVEPVDASINFNRRINPEIVEVLEHVFIHPSRVDSVEEATQSPLNVEVDFDSIQVIGEDRDAIKAEFTTIESLVESRKLEEPDLVGKKDEMVSKGDGDRKPEMRTEAEDEVEQTTTEFEGIAFARSIDVLPNEIPETTRKESTSLSLETVTEVVEVRTEVSVSIEINKTDKATGKPLPHNEIVKQSMSSEKSDKSSEESNSSISSEKKEKKEKRKNDKNSSESSEENDAREILDSDEFRSLNLENKEDKMKLTDELYKDTLEHDIKKKDHPIILPQPYEAVERKFNEEAEIADHLDEKIKPTETRTFEATTVTLYEAFEQVVTTLSDGIKLTNELRSSLDSFREPLDENKTVLDTNNEAISSKNIKNPLVNIAEEMTLENHVETAEAPYLMFSLIGIVCIAVVVSLFVVVKKKSSQIVVYYASTENS